MQKDKPIFITFGDNRVKLNTLKIMGYLQKTFITKEYTSY